MIWNKKYRIYIEGLLSGGEFCLVENFIQKIDAFLIEFKSDRFIKDIFVFKPIKSSIVDQDYAIKIYFQSGRLIYFDCHVRKDLSFAVSVRSKNHLQKRNIDYIECNSYNTIESFLR